MSDVLKSLVRLREATCGASILVVVFGAPTAISAQPTVSAFKPLEINAHVSMIFLGDSEIADRADPATGVRLRYHLPGGFGFGGNFDWTRQGIEVRIVDAPEALFLVNDVFLYSGDVGYTFGRGGRFQYLVGAGIGGATIRQAEREPGQDIRSETFVLAPIGVGMKVLFNSTLALRIDLRDHIVWIGESENREVVLGNEGTIDNVELSAGLSFHLGGR